MQVVVSPEAILQAIEYLKMMCEDQEWSSKEFPLDPENLYRHVGAFSLLVNRYSPISRCNIGRMVTHE
jgi:hypothetical protein